MNMLIGLLIASIIISIVSIVLGILAWEYDYDWGGTISVVIGIVSCMFVLAFILILPCYYSAGVTAEIINKEYDTNYTQNEMFWSKDIIERIIRSKNDVKDGNYKIDLGKE